MRRLPLLILPIALFPGLAAAATVLVTNPEMCGRLSGTDWYEMGMILRPDSLEEIEYSCEFDPPVEFTWTGEWQVVARLGWCNEPGFIEPALFAFSFGRDEPGVVRFHPQGMVEATEFHLCAE